MRLCNICYGCNGANNYPNLFLLSDRRYFVNKQKFRLINPELVTLELKIFEE